MPAAVAASRHAVTAATCFAVCSSEVNGMLIALLRASSYSAQPRRDDWRLPRWSNRMMSRSAFSGLPRNCPNWIDPPPPGPPDRTTMGSGLGFGEVAELRVPPLRCMLSDELVNRTDRAVSASTEDSRPGGATVRTIWPRGGAPAVGDGDVLVHRRGGFDRVVGARTRGDGRGDRSP